MEIRSQISVLSVGPGEDGWVEQAGNKDGVVHYAVIERQCGLWRRDQSIGGRLGAKRTPGEGGLSLRGWLACQPRGTRMVIGCSAWRVRSSASPCS